MDRLILAFLVAGLSVPILVVAYFSIAGLASVGNLGLILVVSTFISFSGVLFLGLPAYLFLRARKWTAFWMAPLAGFIVAAAAWYVFLFLLGLVLVSDKSYAFSHLTAVGPLRGALWLAGPIGAFVGALVWLIARPDRVRSGGNTANAGIFR